MGQKLAARSLPGDPGGSDTIAAISTALGGAVAIIRVSGQDALTVAGRAWRGGAPIAAMQPGRMRLGQVLAADGAALDRTLAVRFGAQASYTGEHLVELHCHGGHLVARAVLGRVLECGARHAEPGEFTKRAFVNGRLDLTQAEAVADVITAQSDMALRLANKQLAGALRLEVNSLYDSLTSIMGDVEARLDFPDEELDVLPRTQLIRELDTAASDVQRLLAGRREGEVLRHGVRVAIAGPPNVGKSSLLNAILGRDRAIVTTIPGTTRDSLEEPFHIRGIPVRLTDTAGIRPAEDVIEESGVRRSLAVIREADVLLWVIDASGPYAPQASAERHALPVVLVANKRDLMAGEIADLPSDLPAPVYTCALTGEGLEDLFDAVEHAVWQGPHTEELKCAVSARHSDLLDTAMEELRDARDQADGERWEVCSVSLRGALRALGQVTGRSVAPDILEAIFSRFCIGK